MTQKLELVFQAWLKTKTDAQPPVELQMKVRRRTINF